MINKNIYICYDKLQPPHIGKKTVWDWMTSVFGEDNCFISTDSTESPLNFEEKQSILAAMGVNSGNVIKCDGVFSESTLPVKFNPSDVSIIWIMCADEISSIPSNIKPYIDATECGKSYYIIIPESKLNMSDKTLSCDKILDFLKTSKSKKINCEDNMETFKSIFGFFDEFLYDKLVDKFGGDLVCEEKLSNVVIKSMLKKCTESNLNDLSKKLNIPIGKINNLFK